MSSDFAHSIFSNFVLVLHFNYVYSTQGLVYYFSMKFILMILVFTFSCKARAFSQAIVKSIYSSQIDELSESQISELIVKNPSRRDQKITLTCLASDSFKYYIGLWHSLAINAPLKQVAEVLDNFNHYSEVFEGIKDAKIIKKNGPENMIVEFENKAPVFFVPNIHYQMEYEIFPLKKKIIYKYHLSSLFKQKNILFSDGLMFLEEVNGVTMFYELDFFNANWGLVEKMAGPSIWHDSIKELVVSDFELKIKAENPKNSTSEKKRNIKNLLDETLVDKCLINKLKGLDFLKK